MKNKFDTYKQILLLFQPYIIKCNETGSEKERESERVRFPPPRTMWTGRSRPKSLNILDLTASTADGLSVSESEEEEESSPPWILSEIFSNSDFSAESCSDACSAIDLEKPQIF